MNYIIYKERKYWRTRNGYYYNDISKNPRIKKALHHIIWEDHHKRKIPEGHIIHHIDGDKDNNKVENLELRERGEHQREHILNRFKDQCYREQNRKQLRSINEKAKVWHGSEDGKKWHSEHGKDTWSENKRKKRLFSKDCVYCNEHFQAYFQRAKYCSRKCNFRHTRNVQRFYKK